MLGFTQDPYPTEWIPKPSAYYIVSGSHVLSTGKNTKITITNIIISKKGKEPMKISSSVANSPMDDLIVKGTIPKGGVINPVSIATTLTMPNQMRSKPRALTVGSTIGSTMIIMEMQSRKAPMTIKMTNDHWPMTNNKPFKQYYRIDEVAEYFSISVRAVYRLIDEGELRRTKIRGCLGVPVTEIERYEKELEKQMTELWKHLRYQKIMEI